MPIPYHILKESSIDQAVDLLLFEAASASASELILEPNNQGASVRMRRDGLVHELFRHSKETHVAFITRLKELAHLREDAPVAAQEGLLRRAVDHASAEGHLSVVPVLEGEKALLRLRPERPGFMELGFSEDHRALLLRVLKRRSGLLLIAGPRRSGLTTTLHALLETVSAWRDHVALIEDRGEADLPGIDQEEADAPASRNFSSLLRSALARGADVIGLGALRDEETAAIAMSAAEHRLVIAVVEADTASKALMRLLDLRVEPRRAAGVLTGVLTERLARRVCADCRRRETLTLNEALSTGWPKSLARKFFDTKSAAVITRGEKCEACRTTGHRGQIGLFELMDLTAPERRRATLMEDGVRKALAGTIAPEELLRLKS